MTDTRITLANRKEMLAALMAVSSAPYVVKGFYPILLQRAGTKIEPEDIDLVLEFAQYEYTKDLPEPVRVTFAMLMPAFKRALLQGK